MLERRTIHKAGSTIMQTLSLLQNREKKPTQGRDLAKLRRQSSELPVSQAAGMCWAGYCRRQSCKGPGAGMSGVETNQIFQLKSRDFSSKKTSPNYFHV